MIRPNNPAIDFETLRARVQAKAELLRASAANGRMNPQSDAIRSAYRAAAAYVDRAEDFAYPQTRVPRRLAVLLGRFGSRPERILLHLYNLALRPAREASAAQSSALRELVKAGVATAHRLATLERQIAELRKKE